MRRPDTLAYVLIAIGGLALLGRVSDGAGWVWMALVAAALLVSYVSQRTYGFLVLGGILAGSAVGLLLQAGFPRCDGVFLISLGAGLIAVDRVERRASRWPWQVGWVLVAIGAVSGAVSSGLLQSTWFALLLIAAGVLLWWRRREATAFPPAVRSGPGPAPAVPPAAPTPAAPAGEPDDRPAAPAARVGDDDSTKPTG